MSKFAFFILLQMMFSVTYADDVTISSFLKTAKDDYLVKNHGELVSYFENASTSTPYFDKIEFRTQTEDFDIMKQDYAIRLYPKGWGETEYAETLHETRKKVNNIEHKTLFNSALKNRYELIIKYLELRAKIDLQKKLIVLYKDKINVLEMKSVNSVNFDITTIISAEDVLVDLQIDLVRLEDDFANVVNNIEQIVGRGAKILFDGKRVMEASSIENIVGKIEPGLQKDNIFLRHRKLRVEMAEKKYQLEVAKNNDFLSFFEFGYDSKEYDDPEKAVTLEFALKFPFINPDRDNINIRKLKHLEEKLKYADQERETSKKISLLTRSLKRLIAQYHILGSRKEKGSAKTSFQKYLEMDGIDPLPLLKIKESILRSNIRITRINFLIRTKYIQLMNILGKLSEKPVRNYLYFNSEKLL